MQQKLHCATKSRAARNIRSVRGTCKMQVSKLRCFVDVAEVSHTTRRTRCRTSKRRHSGRGRCSRTHSENRTKSIVMKSKGHDFSSGLPERSPPRSRPLHTFVLCDRSPRVLQFERRNSQKSSKIRDFCNTGFDAKMMNKSQAESDYGERRARGLKRAITSHREPTRSVLYKLLVVAK